MGLLLFLIVTTAVVPVFSLKSSTCTNQNHCLISCEGCTGISMIPDPTNCHRFYYCNEDQLVTDSPFDCPNGEEFDPQYHQCVLDWDGDGCEPLCPPPPKECHYTCLEGDAIIASQYDCSTYYTCDSMGNPGLPKTCPTEEPYFDGTKCQSNETLCCHCHGYCFPDEVGRLVVDPVDCRRYYVCIAEGLPAQSGICDNGENFDPISQKCSTEAPCRTMCRNVIGPDGCIEKFTCLERDDFPKCPHTCSPFYYACNGFSDTYAEDSKCRSGQFFNEDRGYCTSINECKYD